MAKDCICPNCGHRGKPRTITKGSIWLEIPLWLLFILPGLLYSLWRLSSRHKACPQCGSGNMVPVTTPRGRQLLERFGE